jgi:prophage regulatory protein
MALRCTGVGAGMATSQLRPKPSRMCASMNGRITRPAPSATSIASATRIAYSFCDFFSLSKHHSPCSNKSMPPPSAPRWACKPHPRRIPLATIGESANACRISSQIRHQCGLIAHLKLCLSARLGAHPMQHLSHAANQPSSDESTPPPPLLRMPKVVRMTGLGRSTIYRMIAVNEFPHPVRVGKRAVAWRSADLDRWSADRPSTNHESLCCVAPSADAGQRTRAFNAAQLSAPARPSVIQRPHAATSQVVNQ